MAETTTIYVTKDATSRGIRQVQGIGGPDGYWKNADCIEHFSPSQVHLDLTHAISDAERRRAKKIASLEKQIAALRSLDLSKLVEG